MARENIDTEPVPDTLEGVRSYLARMRADFDSHNHDGANSKGFQTMKSETLTSRTIAMRKTSYASSTAGFWVGLVGATVKFDLGDGTNYLRWDGAALSITAAITGGSITGATITGGTFRTAASGQRIEITASDNLIHIYDASAEVVSIGTALASAFRITLNSNNTDGMKITSATDATLGIRMDSSSNVTFNALRIALTSANTGNDGYCVYLEHAGTSASSYALDISKTGAGNAVRIISSSSADAVNISVSGTNSAAALELNGNTAGRTAPLLNIDDIATASSAPGIRITSSSTVCLDIVGSDANIGAIQIVVSTNSGLNTIGMRMNIANAGAGTECAFEFAGSEYNASITGVSGLTGAIKVLTSDGLVYIPVYGTAT